MNNGFIVSIPKDLSTIKSKLFMGLTKRQIIGFGLGIAVGIPFYLLTFKISSDLAMYGSFAVMCPFFVGTIFQKDRLYADKWIKLWLENKFIYMNKRKFKPNKNNIEIGRERGILRVRKKKSITDDKTDISE
ncbi:PrgI family protein [Erysipelothrix rhusiopathiae]|nr:PrgI family protein [Erysipelothrix rhusiopathiae]